MSDMDGVSEVKDIVRRAHDWGHPAIAITDHGVVQSFPDANHYLETLDADDPFKIIYGVEAVSYTHLDVYKRQRLYPDPTANALVSELAERYGLRKDQVFVGVGSDDVLSMCFLTFFNSDLPILFPDITYSFYKVWAELYRIPYECQPLDEEFHIRMEDYEKENGGIIFPNPNAPTSVGESLTMIEEILKKNQDSVVIIDEAYIDFADNTESAAALLDRYENLLVVQTCLLYTSTGTSGSESDHKRAG